MEAQDRFVLVFGYEVFIGQLRGALDKMAKSCHNGELFGGREVAQAFRPEMSSNLKV